MAFRDNSKSKNLSAELSYHQNKLFPLLFPLQVNNPIKRLNHLSVDHKGNTRWSSFNEIKMFHHLGVLRARLAGRAS